MQVLLLTKQKPEAVFSPLLSKEVANHILMLKIPASESAEGHLRLGPVGESIANKFLASRSPAFPTLGISHELNPEGPRLFGGPQSRIVLKHANQVGLENLNSLKKELKLRR